MESKPVPQPLGSILSTVFEAEGFSGSWPEELRMWEESEPGYDVLIQRQLADAILKDTVTPEQWRELTGEQVGSQERVRIFLRDIWRRYYGYELESEASIRPLERPAREEE